MNVRTLQPSHSLKLFGAGVMLCALATLAAAEEPRSAPGTSGAKTKSTKAATDAGSEYDLGIKTDPQNDVDGALLVKLKKLTPSTPNQKVGEVMVWWTTPGGRRSSFPIRPLAENVWASRLALEPETGRNRVNVVILGKSGDGGLGETTELLYEFEMPAMSLKFLGRKGAGKDKNPKLAKVAPHEAAMVEMTDAKTTVRAEKQAAVSVPAVVILVFFANAALFIPGLLLMRVHRRLSPAVSRHGRVNPSKIAAGPNSTCLSILAEAGLIDRETGRPLALDLTLPNETDAKSEANESRGRDEDVKLILKDLSF